jgi:tRNA threonylcarbamoyl adenosine modification protein YeaZ
MADCTLVIESCTPHASISRVDAEGHIETRCFQSDRNHNALLFEPLADLLDSDPRPAISLVLVGSGPGSYSGTRVGIAAAQGVAIAMVCPAIAVPSILATPSVMQGARCLAIGDARRGSYWHALIQGHDMVEAPMLCDAAGLAATVSQAVADGAVVFSFEEIARFPLPEELASQVKQEFPDAPRLWRTWQETGEEKRRSWSAVVPQPIYLKPPHITPSKRAPLLG